MPTNLPASYSKIDLEMISDFSPRSSFVSYVVQTPVANEAPSITATAILAAWNAATSMKVLMTSQARLIAIHVRVGAAGADTTGDVIAVSSAGTGAPTQVPVNCAVLVKKRTSLGGRHGRGRFFFPYMLPETFVNDVGVIDASRVTTIQTNVDVWFAQHQTATRPMYLFHPDQPVGGAAPPGTVIPGGPPTLIDNLQVSNLIGTQRRRLGR